MTDYGITPVGFLLKSLRDILADENADMLAEISTSLDLSPLSPDGQRNAINARQEAALWEILNTVYDMLDPDRAEDDLLISLCKLTGTVPGGATLTTVTASCTLVTGTTLSAGVDFASVVGLPDSLFTPIEDFTAPSTGVFPVKFQAQTTGPVPCNSGTLTTISTPVTGWTAVTNPLDGRIGQVADSNETLRLRRANELAASGGATVDGIRADMLQLTDTDGNLLLVTCQVNENETDAIDANGLPPHSVECIVTAPISTTADQIAQGVFNTKGGGPASYGNSSGTATDTQGKTYTVRYSVPVLRPVYLIFDLDTNSDYAGDAAFSVSIAASLTAQIASGDSVLVWAAEKAAALPGVTNLHSVLLGFAPSPASAVDLTVSTREQATFDSSRISRI